MLLATTENFQFFAKPIQNYSAFATLLSFYVLTFPDLQRGYRYYQESLRTEASTNWLVITIVALLLLTALALWH